MKFSEILYAAAKDLWEEAAEIIPTSCLYPTFLY